MQNTIFEIKLMGSNVKICLSYEFGQTATLSVTNFAVMQFHPSYSPHHAHHGLCAAQDSLCHIVCSLSIS